MDSIQKTSQLISVVIPVFNEADSLNEFSDHLIKVAESNQYQMEIFIVDDGSDDSTWEVISCFGKAKSMYPWNSLAPEFWKSLSLSSRV